MPSPAKSRPKRRYAAWVFLGSVVGLYLLGGLAHPEIVHQALASLGSLLMRILPAIALVFVLMVVMEGFVERDWLVHRFGSGAPWLVSTLAVVFGVISVGSIYVWYPLLGKLRQDGVGAGHIAMFLYSRALKLPLLPVMIHYFGVAFTVTLSVCIVLFAIFSGLVVAQLIGSAARPADGPA